MIRRNYAISLLQATQDSETLNRLCTLATESAQRLKSIQPLLPGPLRACVQPGPIEGAVWCLLLDNNAAAAKIKQLLPALEAHLRSKGWEVNAIRLKVQMPRRNSAC
jgi:hypothetical protein